MQGRQLVGRGLKAADEKVADCDVGPLRTGEHLLESVDKGREGLQKLALGRAADGSEAILLDQPAYFVKLRPVEEIGRVGGYEHLAAALGVGAELLHQLPYQRGIELILRFLDRQQRVWVWVVEQDEVGKHLNRPVGYMVGDERILETAVLESENEPAVLGRLRLHIAHAWDPLAHSAENLLELRGGGSHRDIAPPKRHCPRAWTDAGVTDLDAGPRVGNVKVRDVPVVNQAAEIELDRELLELAETLDGQRAGVI